MRISADCIEEEPEDTRETLSDQLSRMALNEVSNSEQLDNEVVEDIRVVYRVNFSSKDSTASLFVIPLEPNLTDGYLSKWSEVKQQLLDLNLQTPSKASKSLQFIGRIDSADYELVLINHDEYSTALKVAQLCGQPLEVFIKDIVEQEVNDKPLTTTSTSKMSENTTLNSKQSSSDSENESSLVNNGFVVLESTQNGSHKPKPDSSTQSVGNHLVVMSKEQIEDMKKEITIDVTKRLISKLSECLQELTNENTDSSPVIPEPSVEREQSSVDANCDNAYQQPMGSASKVVHMGIICDNCDHQIEGIRYKCNNCLDFDLCENCKKLHSVHDSSHSFNKIERFIRGIPHTTSHLDFLKPFLSSATIDPKSNDIYLSLDIDLKNGTISSSKISQPTVPSTATKPQSNEQNESLEQTSGENISNGTQKCAEEELIGPQVPQRRYISERKANKITKKLEKYKIKNQMLWQSSDERTTYGLDRWSKAMTAGAYNQNSTTNPSKTLYLSGVLVGDETIPEGTRMPPNTRFRKTWKVRNIGTKVWTGRTSLRCVWGNAELEPYGKTTEVPAPTLRPGEEGKVTIRFTSPSPLNATKYQSHWRLHHRGQPFGQRLVCKIIVDPLATTITATPPVLASVYTPQYPYHKESTIQSTCMPVRSLQKPYNLNDMNGITRCNFESMAGIHQSILESQRCIKALSEHKAMTTHPVLKDRTQKTSAKRLTEALSAVKEIRFNLDDNEAIPLKSNVKSHTTTPANTPFNISPPKSPEPNSGNSTFNQIQCTGSVGTNDKNENKSNEDRDEESDNESLDVLSLSSGDSCDEFVLVPLPSCFDLNVPFNGVDNKGFEDLKDENNVHNKPEEISDEKLTKMSEVIESDEDNTRLEPNGRNVDVSNNSNHVFDSSDGRHKVEESSTEPKSTITSEPSVKPKTSTNPFRDNPNETENVVHVLPESIVTGALSAAAHVYNNVSRALFSRNEGNNFAWVTSPPPAALPLPDMYWDRPTNDQMPQYYVQRSETKAIPVFRSIPVMTPTVPVVTNEVNASAPEPPVPRMTSALKQLYEMGFWNQKLNQELLEKNDFDVNDTIEDLLSPGKTRRQRSQVKPVDREESVVSHQPQNNGNCLEEFD